MMHIARTVLQTIFCSEMGDRLQMGKPAT